MQTCAYHRSESENVGLTCFSESLRQDAISILRRRDRYMLEANSLSSSSSCVLVKAVRIRLHEPPLLVFCRSTTGLGLRLDVLAPPLIGEHDVTRESVNDNACLLHNQESIG
jgi:hypothetical protein